jgi:hypothetical protein
LANLKNFYTYGFSYVAHKLEAIGKMQIYFCQAARNPEGFVNSLLSANRWQT